MKALLIWAIKAQSRCKDGVYPFIYGSNTNSTNPDRPPFENIPKSACWATETPNFFYLVGTLKYSQERQVHYLGYHEDLVGLQTQHNFEFNF